MATLTCSLLQTPPTQLHCCLLMDFTNYASPFFYDVMEPQTGPLFIINPGLFLCPVFYVWKLSTFTGAFHELVSSYGRSAFAFLPSCNTDLSLGKGKLMERALVNWGILMRKHKDSQFPPPSGCVVWITHKIDHTIFSLYTSSLLWHGILCWYSGFTGLLAPLTQTLACFSPSSYSGPVLHYISAAWLLRTLP